MSSGSGNNVARGTVLGAGTTATGVALLPNTSGRNWFFYTAATTVAIGVIMLLLQLVVAIERRRS